MHRPSSTATKDREWGHQLVAGVQLAQARTILQRMAALQQEAAEPVVPMLMGDFNATAHSAVYSFVAEGCLDCSAHDRRDLSGQLAGLSGRPPRPAQVP